MAVDWTWTCLAADGTPVANPLGEQAFPTQTDAESWVGETWRELLEAGVDAVTLLEGARVVYGPMSLQAG